MHVHMCVCVCVFMCVCVCVCMCVGRGSVPTVHVLLCTTADRQLGACSEGDSVPLHCLA